MDSMFRMVAESAAKAIRESAEVFGRNDITVIVEDKGTVEQEVAEALSVAGVCIIIGVTGFSRTSQSGPLVFGSVSFEFRVIERPNVNRNAQGFWTVQQTAEWLVRNLHWRTFDGLGGRPLRFIDFQREDGDAFNIIRLNFQGECSLGMVNSTTNS